MKKGLCLLDTALRNIVALTLFVALIIILQLGSNLLIIVWMIAVALIFLDKSMRFFIVTTLAFGVGFFIYGYVSSYWNTVSSEETRLILHRLSLMFVMLPLIFISLVYRVPFMNYWQKPHWKELVHVPLICTGFIQTKVSVFLVIAMVINVIAFLPFLVNQSWSFFQEIMVFMILFSILNATFEELIWRGLLLSRFSESFGNRWAVVLTSIGFGLQHYSLGFSWIICMAFSVGGFFYGANTIKSKSIVPAVAWHMIINVLMVGSGMIVS